MRTRLARLARHLTRHERPIILLYHRVTTPACDPWNLAVTPEHFARQIALVKRQRRVVRLGWLARELSEGRLPRRAAAITFDDGYADLLHNAKPILERHECPATVFITTRSVGDTRGFWWDVLSRVLLETPTVPERLALDVDGRHYDWAVASTPSGPVSPGFVSRAALHREIHQAIRLVDAAHRWSLIDKIAAWVGTDSGLRQSDRCLTVDELCALQTPDLIEVGAHTLTHVALPSIDPEEMRHEILESRREGEAMIGRPIVGFAYPFGDLDEASRRAVEHAGFEYACTTDAGAVKKTTDPFRLPRIVAADADEGAFAREVLHHG